MKTMECHIEREESGSWRVHDAQERLELSSTIDNIAIPGYLPHIVFRWMLTN